MGSAYIDDRCQRVASYIVASGATIRDAAKKFGMSKSSIHVDLEERLPTVNRTLYLDVRKILDHNKSVRHLRGGEATHRKFANK